MIEPDGSLHLLPKNPSLAMTYAELKASFAEQFHILRSPGLLRVTKTNLHGGDAVPDVKRALREVGFVHITERSDCITARKL